VIVDEAIYFDQNPWPAEPDGNGPSLQRTDTLFSGKDPLNWMAAVATPGAVGGGVVDTDGDGMPDDWEIAHGLDPDDPADADEDADEDGMTNREEFISGTDPNDPSSRLWIREAVVMQNGAVQLEFEAVAGKTYAVEYCEDPALGEWLRLPEVAAPSVGGSETITDEEPSGVRFYRLVTPAQP
jgi:hypothetical protein